MKIIQFVHSLTSGGAERFVVDLSNQLAEMGHDVTICTFSDPDKDPSKGFYLPMISPKVRFHCFAIERDFSIAKMKLVTDYFKRQNPDVIHFHHTGFTYFAPLLFQSHPKVIETIHNIASKAGVKANQKWMTKFLYNHERIIPVTISQTCFDSYVEYYGLKNARMINNGRSPISATPAIESVEAEIDNLKVDKQTKVFLHVARCNPQKNQHLLIDSFNNLIDEGVNAILLIIGKEYDSKLGIELRTKASKGIYFLGEKQNVEDYMLCSDFFCLSSSYEGLPITLLEAMSIGLTPICTPVGGCPDVLTDGKTGFLSDGMTVSAYSECLKRALAKPLIKDDIIKVYMDKYSMETCAKQYCQVYENACRLL